MPDQVLRVGIAGYGRSGCNIHTQWLRLVPERFKIVAVADQLPERRAEAVRDFGCAEYADWRQLLKKTPDLDLFINALPSYLHPKVTIAALEAGHHVVCEKPVAWKVRDFDKVVAASEAAGKRFLPFQNSRFYTFLAKMREVIASGVLGEILHIRIVWSGFGRRWDWQTLQEFQGGNLNNTGPHPMDHAIILFGEQTPQVFCRMKSIQPFGGDAEDFCTVTLHGPGAPVVEVLVSSYQAYPIGEQYTVCGKYGGLSGGPNGLKWKYFDPAMAPQQEFWRPWSKERQYCGEQLPWVEQSWEPPKSDLNMFQALSKAFYEDVYGVLVHGREPTIKLAEVRRQVAAIEACHRQNPLPRRGARA